ncbi:MAG: hypothetical protein JXQ99_09560 [Hyphomicrobiaceae bacterium]
MENAAPAFGVEAAMLLIETTKSGAAVTALGDRLQEITVAAADRQEA